MSDVRAPETWGDPTAVWNVVPYSDVEVQVVGTPSTPYQPQRSLDGTTWLNCLAYDEAGNSYTTIAAAGFYGLTGSGFLRFSAGAGAALTRRAAA